MEPQLIDYYNEKSISMNIPETIKYQFGNGPIRFKKDGKYYHGIDPYQKNSYAWDPSENWIGCIWNYTNQYTINPPPNLNKWDTFDIKKFCCDCSYETNKNKNRRLRFVYQCNGHV